MPIPIKYKFKKDRLLLGVFSVKLYVIACVNGNILRHGHTEDRRPRAIKFRESQIGNPSFENCSRI